MIDPDSSAFSRERSANEAAAWVLRCDRGLTAGEQDELMQWLARDSRHGEELARHRRHWERLAPLAQWRPEHSALPNPDLLAPTVRPRRWVAPKLLAAACVALLAGLSLSISPWKAGAPAAATVVREAASIRRVLEDGTVVELNRGAELVADFTPEQRRVRLLRGEAHFAVTKNPTRPFVVAVGAMDVWAVGTAFNVRMDASAVEVLVTEGRVRVNDAVSRAARVAAPEGSSPAPLVPLLEAGQRAVLSLEGAEKAVRVATLTAGEIERVLAWQHRLFDFTAAPLADVVAEFNRCNVRQLVVVDAELAAVRISATFRSDNLDGFVRLLEVGFGAQAEARGGTEIFLRKVR